MPKSCRFVIVPKVAHPWYDEVRQGAEEQAELLSRELGTRIEVEFVPPARVDVGEQNATLEQAAKGNPDGLALDPVDSPEHLPALGQIRSAGIPVVVFDSPAAGAGITAVGNCFSKQGEIAAEHLAALLGYSGKVAVMQGCPTAPNHQERFVAQLDVLRSYPGIMIVEGGIDNDCIETARSEALAVLAKHPDLKGFLCCDASGPIGIATALKEAGKVGEVKVVSMDGIRPILEAIKEGIIEASSATLPRMQGAMVILMLWQATLGGALPQVVDTGIDVITQANVDAYLARLG